MRRVAIEELSASQNCQNSCKRCVGGRARVKRVKPAWWLLLYALVLTGHNGAALASDNTTDELATDELAKVIKSGRSKAQGCTRCHGRTGMQQFARRADWDYSISTFVIKQLLLFRGDRRKHEIMNAVSKPLSDLDIYEIALWYESVSK